MLLTLYPSLVQEEVFTLTVAVSLPLEIDITVLPISENIFISELPITSSASLHESSSIAVEDQIQIDSSILLDPVACINLDQSFLMDVSVTTQVETIAQINHAIALESDIKAFGMVLVSIDDNISVEVIVKAFEYFKVRSWNLNQRDGISFNISYKSSPFTIKYKKMEFQIKERGKTWSLVNRKSLPWMLMEQT